MVQPNETKDSKIRWLVVSLLFFATTINYIDRQVIGLLKPFIEKDLNWTEADYGYIVPDGQPLWGFPNINDNAEIVEMIASGCHIILFSTGRGSVVGSAISPVIKVCANPKTYQNLAGDMDLNAGKIITEGTSLEALGNEIHQLILEVIEGEKTKSEQLGHQEFSLGYKYFEYGKRNC